MHVLQRLVQLAILARDRTSEKMAKTLWNNSLLSSVLFFVDDCRQWTGQKRKMSKIKHKNLNILMYSCTAKSYISKVRLDLSFNPLVWGRFRDGHALSYSYSYTVVCTNVLELIFPNYACICDGVIARS